MCDGGVTSDGNHVGMAHLIDALFPFFLVGIDELKQQWPAGADASAACKGTTLRGGSFPVRTRPDEGSGHWRLLDCRVERGRERLTG